MIEIVTHARELVGKPWRHRARGPVAYDCIGLVVYALTRAGISVDDRIDYGREPWREGLRAELFSRYGDPVDPEPGCVGLFRWINKEPCHIGIIGNYRHGGLSLIHSHSSHNVTEHALSGAWLKLFVEAYRPWHK